MLTYVLGSINIAVPKSFKGKAAVIIKKTLLKVVVLLLHLFIIYNSPLYKGCDFFCWFFGDDRTISLFGLVEL